MTRAGYFRRMHRIWPLLLLAACATRTPADLIIEPTPLPKSAGEVEWREDGEGALTYARSQEKPALLYFTAHW